MRFARISTALATCALALTALPGCTPNDVFAPICPQLALVKDAADLTRFNGRGEDISDLDLTARLSAVPAACSQTKRSTVDADLQVVVAIARGPARTDRTASVPYFVAVTDAAGKLIDKQNFVLGGTFPPNVDRMNATSEKLTLSFPVSDTVKAADYRIYVGFALTPQELAYNRKMAGAR